MKTKKPLTDEEIEIELDNFIEAGLLIKRKINGEYHWEESEQVKDLLKQGFTRKEILNSSIRKNEN